MDESLGTQEQQDNITALIYPVMAVMMFMAVLSTWKTTQEPIVPPITPPITPIDPGSIILENLQIIPHEVIIGQQVRITVDVSNTGDQPGSYEVGCAVDGNIMNYPVALNAHESSIVGFVFIPLVAKTYDVTVDGLHDKFTASPQGPLPGAITFMLGIDITSLPPEAWLGNPDVPAPSWEVAIGGIPIGREYTSNLLAITSQPMVTLTITIFDKDGRAVMSGNFTGIFENGKLYYLNLQTGQFTIDRLICQIRSVLIPDPVYTGKDFTPSVEIQLGTNLREIAYEFTLYIPAGATPQNPYNDIPFCSRSFLSADLWDIEDDPTYNIKLDSPTGIYAINGKWAYIGEWPGGYREEGPEMFVLPLGTYPVYARLGYFHAWFDSGQNAVVRGSPSGRLNLGQVGQIRFELAEWFELSNLVLPVSVARGGTFTATVTVKNTGNIAATRDIEWWHNCGPGYSADRGGTVIQSVTLAPNESKQLSITLTVPTNYHYTSITVLVKAYPFSYIKERISVL